MSKEKLCKRGTRYFYFLWLVIDYTFLKRENFEILTEFSMNFGQKSFLSNWKFGTASKFLFNLIQIY